MGLGDPRNGEYYYCTTFSKGITSTWMRYLDYWFNKPTLPSPLETLEILCLVIVTLSWYHNIRKGARGDRFFGSQSITAIFTLKNEHSLSFLFSAWCTLNWDYGTISWSSHALQQPCIMDSLLYYLFAWRHSMDSELSRRIARACLVSIYRWQMPILFRFIALIESIWNGESNEIETSRIHCKVAKIWIFRNSEYFHWKFAIFPLKKEARRLDQCEVCGGVRTQVFWMNRVAWGRDNMLASSKVGAVGGTNTRSDSTSKSKLAVNSFEKGDQKIGPVRRLRPAASRFYGWIE
jgi:hypothetical protein